MKKIILAAAITVALAAAQGADVQSASKEGKDWGPMPYPTPVNEPSIKDFAQAAQMIDKTSSDPAFVDKFATYRMCTELALRALAPHYIDPVGAMTYTAVRGCTRQMDNYVLLFVQDERFKANYYVAHAIQRIAQQEQQTDLLPLAERLHATSARSVAPGLMEKIKDFFNIDQQPKRSDKT